MSAVVKKIPQNDWEVIKKYLNDDFENLGIVLIPEKVYQELPVETQTAIENLNEYDESYDFGGDANIWMDVVLSAEHNFIQKIKEDASSCK